MYLTYFGWSLSVRSRWVDCSTLEGSHRQTHHFVYYNVSVNLYSCPWRNEHYNGCSGVMLLLEKPWDGDNYRNFSAVGKHHLSNGTGTLKSDIRVL